MISFISEEAISYGFHKFLQIYSDGSNGANLHPDSVSCIILEQPHKHPKRLIVSGEELSR